MSSTIISIVKRVRYSCSLAQQERNAAEKSEKSMWVFDKCFLIKDPHNGLKADYPFTSTMVPKVKEEDASGHHHP